MIEKVQNPRIEPLHSNNIDFISERWYQVQQALLMSNPRNILKVLVPKNSEISDVLTMRLRIKLDL